MNETSRPGPSWYTKCFAYIRHHGRVDPAKVELPHCDFFIVGERRTLRVLKPQIKGRWFYEPVNDRPESINDNFFSRWSKRPHPSGNCRCSFRQSARLSSNEERIISQEINRIRSSLCEAEKNGQDIEEIEKSVKFDTLIPVSVEPKKSVTSGLPIHEENIFKNKIIKDLERYINDLLQEILTDSVKFVADAEKLGCREKNQGPIDDPASSVVDGFVNINFDFHAEEEDIARKIEEPGVGVRTGAAMGYENSAFLGSSNDPDNLEFYLNRPMGKSNLEQLDCVDSGINSVETVEFQPEQELSLEESLMEIIDAKLGRTHLRKSWEDFKTSTEDQEKIDEEKRVKEDTEIEETNSATESSGDTRPTRNSETLLDDEFNNIENNFDNVRLEFGKKFKNEEVHLRRKVDSLDRSEVLIQDQEDTETLNIEDSSSSTQPDFVLYRKNRKPTIVFLHGFGSSADVFERQLEYFSNLGYPCIAPDMLGHGLSSAPDRASDYRFEKLLNDLDVLLHHYAFRPARKCVIVAHNYGSAIPPFTFSKPLKVSHIP